MKPIIGIIEGPYIDMDGDLVYNAPNSIVEQIAKHDALPVGIFPTQIEKYQTKKMNEIEKLNLSEKEDLHKALSMCDAIIKPGALRIYEYERYAYQYAYEKNMPFLGMCAGMQMMAQFNSDCKNIKNDTERHRSKKQYVHSLKILKDTLLYNILKKEEIMVNSRHMYHIANSGIHSINAYSDDGLIEGIENNDKSFHLGLQWHPESLDDDNTEKIFDEFIYQAVKYRKKKL